MDLEQRAQAGDVRAQLALAARNEEQGNNDMARGWLARAARGGHPDALRLLAASLMVKDPIRPTDGAEMMRAAAMQGDAQASFISAAIAGQASDDPGRWLQALEFLERSALQGLPHATQAMAVLSGGPQVPLAAIAREILAREARARDAVQMQFEAPRIGICRGFAGAAECDWLMARARPRLGAAQVYDPHTGGGVRVESSRTNSDVNFNMVESDLVLVMLRARVAAMLGASVSALEPAMVLHYAPGQYFAPHWDGLDPDVPGMAADIAAKGQRTATFLLYLNDDYEGGDTEFPDMNWSFRGGVGDALFFWNTDPAGCIDRKTRHAGTPTRQGEKWLLSQWIRGPKPAI